MNEIITKSPISIRPATLADLPFIDSLQKMHSKQVGWMPTKTLEGKINLGEVLIAEMPPPLPSPGIPGEGERVGYCMGQDRYFKRDDVGIIYQMNIVPGHQRGLIGASLLKAQFERSAWGCKLYCCWCAQDISANKFWEAMGFVALAYRAGSEAKSRVHIFWQRRIRAGDASTPYWFPSQTTGGSIREDRLVLPIPPGTHWGDAKPLVLPQEEAPTPALPRGTGRGSKERKPKAEVRKARPVLGSPLRFEAVVEKPQGGKVEKVKKQKRKNDPRLISAARELRDRWLEQVNSPAGERLLAGCGKYEVSRALGSAPAEGSPVRQLTAAAA